MGDPEQRGLFEWIQLALMLVLTASTCCFVLKTIHWPVTGDVPLMHYVTFLMDHGRAPYKDIGDMNLPMSYVPPWMVSHLFGAGDLPWRLSDLTLLLYFVPGAVARPSISPISVPDISAAGDHGRSD